MMRINPKKLKPYGDRMEDGAIQLSFTFPIKPSPEAKEGARIYAKKLGLDDIVIANMEDIGSGFTMFVIFAKSKNTIDLTKIRVPKLEFAYMNYKELTDYMSKKLKKPIVVVGGTTGSDAHTVGLDAIMNMKGFNHDYGLERYPLFKAYNLRSQLSNKALLDKAVELEADAILISQIVTQRNVHMTNLKEFINLVRSEKRLSKDVILIIGGPRLEHGHAVKLGFHAGFGPGTMPSQVASFIVHEYLRRLGKKQET